mmetsp:Transcript_42104/g.131004  ORF Transcript_42104/g.131004 Transcript_42104/m.131004 type:complete len:553 (+) Transcript_42104:13-1671(+)
MGKHLEAAGTGQQPLPSNVDPLLPQEMEKIRKVWDEDSAGKKHCAIASPREDAEMFRRRALRAPRGAACPASVPCECIVELYELLWRWGHRNTDNRSFEANFGFAIPDTVVFEKGKPYAWYFISRKDGTLLRKSAENLTISAMEKKFCPEQKEEGGEASPPISAVWYPKASQFPEARCHSEHAEFLSVTGCAMFLASLRITHSGVLQSFVYPHGVSNFLVRTVQFLDRTSLCTRTNRALLARGTQSTPDKHITHAAEDPSAEGTRGRRRSNLFDRAATFEGWEGLSSSSSRYRSHRHPHMEELILAAGETLSRRITQERVRQMLFLPDDQHVALHFKVNADNQLCFIYASVVSEKEVIVQTRPQLLMGDECMTEDLPGAALLPGGSERKALPYEVPSFLRPPEGALALEVPEEELRALATIVDEPVRESSLPPIRQPSRPQSGGRTARRRPLSERRSLDVTILPRMPCTRPEVPPVPYRFQQTPRGSQESYDFPPSHISGLDMIKRPLVEPFTARSEPPLTARPPLPPRGEPPRPSSARRREPAPRSEGRTL